MPTPFSLQPVMEVARNEADAAAVRLGRALQTLIDADRKLKLLLDYRDVEGQFDGVASIEMVEAVGAEYWDAYLSTIARVLKPGGRLVFIDSLQMGDRPDWGGLLEAFPVRFHEPYYRHYVTDDLDCLFADAGLVREQVRLAFLSKVMVRRRAR